MLSRPSTEQIILDCRAELLSTINGALTDAPARIAVQMMENVLRNCATRAAHEIAWMREETDAMIAFAERVAASTATSPELDGALARYRADRSDSLHLDDVSTTYGLAGECLSTGLEAAMAAGDDELQRAGRDILELRLAHEQQIMGEWVMVGRAE
jgi:hypothetical protein